MRKSLGIFLLAGVAMTFADVAPAEACGGCFVPPSESTVVTDHRMALSMSRQQTVLWDQIRYSGDPAEFAWVLPVRQGAKIELANDEFFTALDSSSQPTIFGPTNFAGNVGCGLTGCSAESESAAGSLAADGTNGNVTVISQSVVGPYEQVTLRATDEDSLTTWLRTNDFTIPPAIEPTISAYVTEGFDFIALKLRPDCGERSMRPVRVVSPGADPTLPLRMVAAGVGAQVGIILYVISEGRYEPENFPSTKIEDDELLWSRFENKSNYEPLSQEIMKRENGRTWILEYADKPQLPVGPGYQSPSPQFNAFGRQRTPGLTDTYYGLCKGYERVSVAGSSTSSSGFGGSSSGFGGTSSSSSSGSSGTFTPCPEQKDAGNQNQFPFDGGNEEFDASGLLDGGNDDDAGDGDDDNDGGVAEAGANDDDAGVVADAGSDGGGIGDGENKGDGGLSTPKNPPSSRTGNPRTDCAYLDDLDTAISGLNRNDVWVTRMRSILPTEALTSGDLRLKPSLTSDGRADTTPISNLHWTPYYADEQRPTSNNKTGCEGSPKTHRTYGSWVLAMMGALFGITYARRRNGRR